MNDDKPTLCLDFDGVIHRYDSGWKGPCEITDDVTDGFFEWLDEAAKHFRIVVYSSRSKEPGACDAMALWLAQLGCMKVGPACDGCYAWAQHEHRYHRVEFGGPGIGIGTRQHTTPGYWKQPLRWNRKAQEAGTKPFVFGGSLMDPFDNHVDPAWQRAYFGDIISKTPHLVWLLLTKRPLLIVDLAEDADGLPPTSRWALPATIRNIGARTSADSPPPRRYSTQRAQLLA